MPPIEFHQIAERHHRIMNPFTDAKLLLLGEICRANANTHMLDLACGKGEMLCRWAQTYGIQGVGVDYFQVFLDAAQERAQSLGVADRLQFIQGDAAQYPATQATYDIVSCLGATWIGGGIAGTINLMKTPLKADGLMLVGEPYWIEEPPEPAYAAWNMKKGEYVSLVETLDRIESADMELVEMVLSNPEDWDRYEARQWMAVSDYLCDHPDDPTAQAAAEWKAQQRRAYLQYARPYFGWGVFVLRRAIAI